MALTDFLSDFQVVAEAPLPAFNDEGCLPAGDYQASREEFERRFVVTGDRDRRASIYRGWDRHRRALIEAGLPDTARQLVDGSYTTNKESPGDIDIAVQVPMSGSAAMASLTPDHSIVRLLLGPAMKAAYFCDAYPVYSLPKDDPPLFVRNCWCNPVLD
jgi:hypothetical protein